MLDVQHTDVEVANPSTPQERQDAAQRQADSEVGAAQEAINVCAGDAGTRMGDDSRLWWPVSYEVVARRHR
jgi:hypothetical protein